jgi:hypothetical protein
VQLKAPAHLLLPLEGAFLVNVRKRVFTKLQAIISSAYLTAAQQYYAFYYQTDARRALYYYYHFNSYAAYYYYVLQGDPTRASMAFRYYQGFADYYR